MNESRSLVLRGTKVSEDIHGHIRLDDIWRLAKANPSKLPKHWRTTVLAKALISELQKKVTTGNVKDNSPLVPVIYAKQGRGNEGTFAHPVLAAAYAGYLSPKLEIEVREVWLRYRKGDATLADEILQRATAEENKWAGARALARSERVTYTGVLKRQGVEGKGYMRCTEAVYVNLLGGKSFEIRDRRGLAPKVNLRDNLDVAELSYVMAAEALSSERILEENRQGNAACEEASGISAGAIRRAIEEDRRNRQRPLV
jgi:hypothetical protein